MIARTLAAARRMPYAVFWSLDAVASALTGGRAGQLLSARFEKGRKRGTLKGTIAAEATDWVALKVFRQPNHCATALDTWEKTCIATGETP